MDCIDEVLAELREQRRISRESDAAINEIMPNSQLCVAMRACWTPLEKLLSKRGWCM